jgi:hypothetical protein
MWGFEHLTAEQIAEWQRSIASQPKIVSVSGTKCDSCKKFMSLFNMYMEHAGYHCHLNEWCLETFRVKYLQHADFHKPGAAMIIGDGVMV